MRVPVGKALRAGPGDQVEIRGRLPPDAKLGRLFVFASEKRSKFSPYVPNVADMLVNNGRPQILSPLMFRLHDVQPVHTIRFKSDIDGFFRVMQEVDEPDDPRVAVTLTRKINPNLGWGEWIQRKLAAWQIPASS